MANRRYSCLPWFYVILLHLPHGRSSWSSPSGGVLVWDTALQAGRSRVRVVEHFHWLNSPGRIMALGSTHPVTQMSIMAGAQGTPYISMCRLSGNLWTSTFWNHRDCPGPYRDNFTFYYPGTRFWCLIHATEISIPIIKDVIELMLHSEKQSSLK
jgi:hypothetical protein